MGNLSGIKPLIVTRNDTRCVRHVLLCSLTGQYHLVLLGTNRLRFVFVFNDSLFPCGLIADLFSADMQVSRNDPVLRFQRYQSSIHNSEV